jgi:sulfide dehydrogenase cytochrome subunit
MGKVCLASAFLLAGIATAQASNLNQARYIAANCANCHGTNGNSVGGVESLAGYDRDKFISVMKAFKSGEKPATIMHQISQGYSDEQVAALAEFFASQPSKR